MLSCVVGVIPAALVALVAGAALAIVTGQGDIAVIMNSIGLPAVGLIALVLLAWTVNASNVYSAGLGFAVMRGLGEGGSKLTTAVSGIAGIALAVGGILGQFEAFLTVLSACGPALAGVMVADYWLVRKGRPAGVRVMDGVSAAGVARARVRHRGGARLGGTFARAGTPARSMCRSSSGPVNGIVVAMAAYALSYRLAGGEAVRGHHPQTARGIDPYREPCRTRCGGRLYRKDEHEGRHPDQTSRWALLNAGGAATPTSASSTAISAVKGCGRSRAHQRRRVRGRVHHADGVRRARRPSLGGRGRQQVRQAVRRGVALLTKPVYATMPMEAGGVNSMLPIAAAARSASP